LTINKLCVIIKRVFKEGDIMGGIGHNVGASDWRKMVGFNKEKNSTNSIQERKEEENMGVSVDDLPEPVQLPDDNKKSIQEVKMSKAALAAAELLREELNQEQEQEDYKLAKDKQYEKLMEFVNVLVNGDAISQLFINNDLTDKAKEELIKLQEATTGKNISKAKQELEELKKTIEDFKKESEELSKNVQGKKEELETLTNLVGTLEKKRALLSQFINNDLSTIVEVMREPEEESEDNYEWRWKPTDWKGIYGFIQDEPITIFDSYLDEQIKDYSRYNDCSYEAAKRQFYELSPQIEYISNYLKEHASELSGYTSFYTWFCKGANDSIKNSIRGIKIPTYEIVKVKVKRHK
jgi:hypothetical protein